MRKLAKSTFSSSPGDMKSPACLKEAFRDLEGRLSFKPKLFARSLSERDLEMSSRKWADSGFEEAEADVMDEGKCKLSLLSWKFI